MRSPVRAIRLPWGEGNAAKQKAIRSFKAGQVVNILADKLDQEQIQMTGQLFPTGSLKRAAVRACFKWTCKFRGRVFTKPLLKIVVRRLIRKLGPVPLDPKQSFGAFVSAQAKRLGKLIRAAKRMKEGWGLFKL